MQTLVIFGYKVEFCFESDLAMINQATDSHHRVTSYLNYPGLECGKSIGR